MIDNNIQELLTLSNSTFVTEFSSNDIRSITLKTILI